MKRYSIIVRERGADKEHELCQCDTSPDVIVAAAREKYLLIDSGEGKRKTSVPKYEHVYVVDHEAKT